MKTVIIIRHAKSSWAESSVSDFDRLLDKRGLRDGPLMARRLKAAGYHIDQMVSSSAVRAKTTALFFGTEFNIPVAVSDNLYHGMPEDYMEVIHTTNDAINCLALFGHNPGITYLANMIQSGVTNNIPTCGIIIASTDKKSWQGLSWQDFTLINLMFPKDSGNE